MCGRYTLTTPADELASEFGADVPAGYEPRYNIAPQQPVLVLGLDGAGRRRLAFLRWGLVPWWSSPAEARAGPINARAETVAQRPAFRDAFRARRCLVVADGFYEWKRVGRTRIPFRFHLRDGGLMTFAAIWETWDGAGEPLHTCAILTTGATERVAVVHDRMPAILVPEVRDRWIDPAAEPGSLLALLQPFADERLEAYEVSRLVNSVANESPGCILPA